MKMRLFVLLCFLLLVPARAHADVILGPEDELIVAKNRWKRECDQLRTVGKPCPPEPKLSDFLPKPAPTPVSCQPVVGFVAQPPQLGFGLVLAMAVLGLMAVRAGGRRPPPEAT